MEKGEESKVEKRELSPLDKEAQSILNDLYTE